MYSLIIASLAILAQASRSSVAPRNGATATVEVEAIKQGEDWVTTIKVGNQVLQVQIDTGSSDLWLASTLLPSNETDAFKSNKFYDPTKSSTWVQNPDLDFHILYGDGSLGASGIAGTETIEIGGTTVQMTIGVANSIFGDDILESTYDGVMGMGFRGLSSIYQSGTTINQSTIMEALQDTLAQPVFTTDFRANNPNTMSFGSVNQSLYTGNLQTLPVDNSSSYWVVKGVSVSSGNSQLSSTPLDFIFDTGGLNPQVDATTAAAYWALVSGSKSDNGQYIFPCNTATLPDLTYNFPDGSATVSGAAINGSASSVDGTMCIGGLQASSALPFQLGFPFFDTYFTVWNQADPSISFAKYSNVQDTAGTNEGNLPTLTSVPGFPSATGTAAGSATTTATHKNAAGRITWATGAGVLGLIALCL